MDTISQKKDIIGEKWTVFWERKDLRTLIISKHIRALSQGWIKRKFYMRLVLPLQNRCFYTQWKGLRGTNIRAQNGRDYSNKPNEFLHLISHVRAICFDRPNKSFFRSKNFVLFQHLGHLSKTVLFRHLGHLSKTAIRSALVWTSIHPISSSLIWHRRHKQEHKEWNITLRQWKGKYMHLVRFLSFWQISENSNWLTALTLILQTMELLWKADIWSGRWEKNWGMHIRRQHNS